MARSLVRSLAHSLSSILSLYIAHKLGNITIGHGPLVRQNRVRLDHQSKVQFSLLKNIQIRDLKKA